MIEHFSEEAERDDELAERLMLRHGIPRDVVSALRSVSRSFRAWGGSSAPSRTRCADGSELAFADRTLEVLHRPGHSPSDTLFHDRERADPARRRPPDRPHLVQPADLAPARRPVGRARQRAPAGAADLHAVAARDARDGPGASSSRATASRSPTTCALIDERFALHERRARKIGGLIEERPRSAYEIAQELWGNVAVTQAYLTLCEVLGHVDLLLEEGRVAEREAGGVVRFEAVG